MRNRDLFVRIVGNRDKMNDSVIICEPNTPIRKNVRGKKQRARATIQCKDSGINDLNDELSKGKIRMPLRTVYESPLNHDISDDECNGNASLKRKTRSKRQRGSQSNDVPPRKKQKIADVNETIVILSDDDDDPSVESDVILVDESTPQQSKKKVSPRIIKKKTPKSAKRKVKKSNRRKSLNAAPSNVLKDGDDEELAVVWSSASTDNVNVHVNANVDTKESVNVATENPEADNLLFYIDTKGDERNFERDCCLSPMPEVGCSQELQPEPPQVPANIKEIKITEKTKKKKKSDKSKHASIDERPLREIIVDGCNVAFGFSHNKEFSKMGLKLVLDYFHNRGHTVKIFLPQHKRKRDRDYLEEWYNHGFVIFTPSRNIGGKNIVPYDDRYILDYATKCKGIVVSSDQYRDLYREKPEWRDTIEKRLLPPTFVGDYVMFPEDPLGRGGPNLEAFLRLDD